MKFTNTIQSFTNRSNSKFLIVLKLFEILQKKRVKEKGIRILSKNHVLSYFNEFITSSNPHKNSES